MSYLKKIIESKKNHPSVATITENVLPDSLSFDLLPTSKEDINKIIKSLNASKVTGPDGVTLKLIQLSANFVDKYLTSFINHDILRSCFSLGAKTYLIRAIHKKKDRQNKGNYHPLSILNGFSTRSLWEVHKWEYAPYKTNFSLKLCFNLQKILKCKPCTSKSNRKLEKEPQL